MIISSTQKMTFCFFIIIKMYWIILSKNHLIQFLFSPILKFYTLDFRLGLLCLVDMFLTFQSRALSSYHYFRFSSLKISLILWSLPIFTFLISLTLEKTTLIFVWGKNCWVVSIHYPQIGMIQLLCSLRYKQQFLNYLRSYKD